MLIAILGGVGSGKSVSAVKRIYESDKHCFINFKMKEVSTTRIKKEHIVKETITGYTARTNQPIKKLEVNWEYWNIQLKRFIQYHMFIDEIHNLIHSRQSMTKWNTLCSMWISQIRKILGDGEETHLYMISQRLKRIDVAFRDLLHVIIGCEKVKSTEMMDTLCLFNGRLIKKRLNKIYIIQYFFTGENCKEKYMLWMMGKKTYDYRTVFLANPYFRLYDTYEIFGETAYV